MKIIKSITAILLITLSFSYKDADPFNGNELFRTVEKYVSLGEHRTGTVADTATSFWLKQELSSYGYTIQYLEFPVRQFFPEKVFLSNGRDTINAFPMWWVNEQISREVSGTLTDAANSTSLNRNSIAL